MPTSSSVMLISFPRPRCPTGDAACFCKAQARDGMFADAAAQPACSRYYQCWGESAYYRSCGAGLVFNDQQL